MIGHLLFWNYAFARTEPSLLAQVSPGEQASFARRRARPLRFRPLFAKFR